uniref:Fe2OG dioxygenase domain-containing protein n=1 Tax=Parascaris univalens TaxID=6257 RepID=A0A915AU06_PARUN
MLLPIITTLFRNFKLNWRVARRSFSINIKRSTMSACVKQPSTADSSSSSTVTATDRHADGDAGTKSNSDSSFYTGSDVRPKHDASHIRDAVAEGDIYRCRSVSPADSVFKRAFKFYKKRCPPPDLSEVIDFRASSLPKGVISTPLKEVQSLPREALSAVGLKPFAEWRLFEVLHRRGLFVLSDVFEPSRHLEWIARCLTVYPEAPNKTNVGLHIPDVSQIFLNHTSKLRWATLGYHYDWTTKIYPSSGEPLPSELVTIADIISRALGIGPMQADAAIINYYPAKSTLSPHVDRSERFLIRPLISLSFGQSAVYLSGGTSLDDPVDAFFLHSGDVLVMYAKQRLVYHAVPHIEKTRDFEPDAAVPREVVEYANKNRINVTIRQVDRHCESE